MAAAVSKRQQARNERTLQDLIATVPGNDRCADCAAKNPGWASWNLGIFLCVRCASLHRKLGTHVSKVKSLTMDSWTAEQVDSMKKTGNVISNHKFNPTNVKAEIPIDVDEVDGAMERYVRQKYEQRALSGDKALSPAMRHNTGSTGTGSWNEEGPALPPKPTKRFGFTVRSASSTFPRPKRDRITPPLSPTFSGDDRYDGPPSPQKTSKASRLFGKRITSVSNNFDEKLGKLRDMGFGDNKKNTEILKSCNGNLDRTIETLVRLGEGSDPASRSHTPGPRTMTPVSMSSSGANGLTIEKTRRPERAQTDPTETREELLRRAATQPLPPLPHQLRTQASVPSLNSTNPFLKQTQQHQTQQNLENSFQALQVSRTGPASETQQHVHQVMNGAPPMPQIDPWQPVQSPWEAQQNHSPAIEPQRQSSNPFLRHTQSQTFTPSNPWGQTSPQQLSPTVPQSTNPFGMSWQQPVFQQPMAVSPSPMYGSQPEYFSQPQPAEPVQMHTQQNFSTNPWEQQAQQFSPQQTAFHQPQPQQFQPQQQQPQQQYSMQQPLQSPQQTSIPQQQLQPQQHFQQQQQPQYQQPQIQQQPQQFQNQPVRHDKSSILALYNTPSPFRPLQTLPEDGGAAATAQPVQAPIQRSATMPVHMHQNGSLNPFGAPNAQPTGGSRHVSNESKDFVGFSGNGRHSPDAFSGLSARYMG